MGDGTVGRKGDGGLKERGGERGGEGGRGGERGGGEDEHNKTATG